jgi:hypothetical protein
VKDAGRKPEGPAHRQSVCLITALTVADFFDRDLIIDAHANTGAQLGILTLAALLREQGLNPTVLNLDDLFYELRIGEISTVGDIR